MHGLPASLQSHRVEATDTAAVCDGRVRWAPVKSLWFLLMFAVGVIGSALTFSLSALALYVASTAAVLLLGHSLGNHRKLVHDSYECPKWLEYFLVYCGVHVGLAGPLGLLKQHDLRDFSQRLPRCHDYLRHGRRPLQDAWWQLNCELALERTPAIHIEPRIAADRFYVFLERTWMAHHLLLTIPLYGLGGWAFVCWGLCARVATTVFGHWFIGYLAHNHGEVAREVQGAAVQGHNVRFASLLTMGECWHNNHHAFPGSARLGLKPDEWDPGWWMLCALEWLGLVWRLRLPEDLPERPELKIVGGVPSPQGMHAFE
jgi:stearoyl-CoA desaturase (delta-9 desaturase)